MTTKRFIGMIFIWLFTTLAWVILSGTVTLRTHAADRALRAKVGSMWGQPQVLQPPAITWTEKKMVEKRTVLKDAATGKETTQTQYVRKKISHPVHLISTDLHCSIEADPRRKGLLWYATYRADLSAVFTFRNNGRESRTFACIMQLPDPNGVYDRFECLLDGEAVPFSVTGGAVRAALPVDGGTEHSVTVTFRSFGQDEWRYRFRADEGVERVPSFRAVIDLISDELDFPDGTLSPTAKSKTESGWHLTWDYTNLMSGSGIGVRIPSRVNPGPFVARVTRFAPVSLLFFFFVLFIITTLRRTPLRLEHYFFLACAFFAFHLLFAYLADHVALIAAFSISSAVSIFLVVTYLRLVMGSMFALREAGMSQLVYLVLFSYSFFFEGFTGLIVTVGAILTLFIAMQMTGRRGLDMETE